MMRICGIMDKGVIFCYPEDNLKTVAAMLKENQLISSFSPEMLRKSSE
jgi:predicted transcriptional regulator